MTTYLVIFAILFVFMALYVYFAGKAGFVDVPISRSSHRQPVINGGGIIFPVAAVVWFLVFGWEEPFAIAGLILIGFISFIDDMHSLPRGIRIVAHALSIGLLFYDIGLFGMYWYLSVAALIITVGWLNAFNFMDGINGITAFSGLVTLGTFSVLNHAHRFIFPFFGEGLFPDWHPFYPSGLIGTLFIGLLVFAFFNARKKAVVFAGDVGSISLAFLQSWMMINLMIMTREAWWILMFSVYGIDTVMTILIRLQQGENILEAHRKHLYQLLANEKKIPHLTVSLFYALLQGMINLVLIVLVFNGMMRMWMVLPVLVLLTLVYLFYRSKITGKPVFSA